MIDPVQATPVGITINTTAAASLVFDANVTSGNLIVVYIAAFNNVTFTVTDSLGNTYNLIVQANNGNAKAALFYAKNITGGACTITVTPSATAYISATAAEYEGAVTGSPLDGSATNTGSGATAISTGSVPVNNPGSLVVGVISWNGSMRNFKTDKFRAVACQLDEASREQMIALDSIQDAAIAATCVVGNAINYAAVCASFIPVNGGGGGGGSTQHSF